jgi:Ribonuclease G/E
MEFNQFKQYIKEYLQKSENQLSLYKQNSPHFDHTNFSTQLQEIVKKVEKLGQEGFSKSQNWLKKKSHSSVLQHQE